MVAWKVLITQRSTSRKNNRVRGNVKKWVLLVCLNQTVCINFEGKGSQKRFIMGRKGPSNKTKQSQDFKQINILGKSHILFASKRIRSEKPYAKHLKASLI